MKKVLSKKITLKQIELQLKKLGYTLESHVTTEGESEFLITVEQSTKNDSNDDDDDYYYNSWNDDKDVSIKIVCNTLTYCCGVYELGDLTIEYFQEELIDKVVTLLTTYAFLAIKQHIYRNTSMGRNGIRCVRPLMFCSNGDEKCKFAESALKTLSEHYKLISTTRNPGSGNTIKTYISKG